jgi:hypothetical protein
MIWLAIFSIWFLVMMLFRLWYDKRSAKKRKEILDSRETDKGKNLNDKLIAEESRKRFRNLPRTYR